MKPSWMDRAACVGLTPMFILPEDAVIPSVEATEHWEAARAVCQCCPVRIDCLRWAMTKVPPDDKCMYAGLAPAKRRREFYRYRNSLAKAS